MTTMVFVYDYHSVVWLPKSWFQVLYDYPDVAIWYKVIGYRYHDIHLHSWSLIPCWIDLLIVWFEMMDE